MKNIDKEAIIEGFKELLRTALIAVIPLVIAGLSNGTVDWEPVWIVGAISVLRGIDKWLHETDKKPFESVGVEHKGLVPF